MEVICVKISAFEFLYFHTHTLCKPGGLTNTKTSLKHVLWVNRLYMKLERSKLSGTSCVGKKIDHSVSGINFIFRSEILDAW